jgi:hypothetical protein
MDKVTLATETALGPNSSELLGAEYGKRRRNVLIAIVVLVVLVGGGVGTFAVMQAKAAKQKANDAYGELSQCLFGGPPPENPATAFRFAQLRAMGFVSKERAPVEGKPWPERCAPSALRVVDTAKDAGIADEGEKTLLHFARELGKQLELNTSYSVDLSEIVNLTFAELKRLELVATPPKDMTGPPEGDAPMTLDDLKKTEPITKAFFSFDSIRVEQNQGEDRYFLVQDATVEPPAFFCTPGASSLQCNKVPANVKASLTLNLLGTTDVGGYPLIFAGERGDAGIFRGDTGEEVDHLYAYGGWVDKAGTAFILGFDTAEKKPLIASRKRGEAKPTRNELKLDVDVGNYFYSTQLLWDQVFVRGRSDKNERRLLAHPIDAKKRNIGEGVDIGELPEYGLISDSDADRAHISGCRSKDFRVVRVKGRDNDFLSFFVNGKWSKPHAGQFFNGRLSCGATGATVTYISQLGTINELRCTSANCQAAGGDMVGDRADLKPKERLFDVVSVGDKVIGAWSAGDRGGIRVRVALAAEIGKAKDIIVLDDLVYDSKVQSLSSVSDLGLVSAEDHALLLLGTKTGVYALRIATDGKITPETVAWR